VRRLDAAFSFSFVFLERRQADWAAASKEKNKRKTESGVKPPHSKKIP
jgi:hypothetical protein